MAQGQAKHARYEKAQNIGDHFLSSRIPAAVPALPKITKAKPPDDAVSPEPISQATESTSVPATARHPRRPRLSAWQRPEGLLKSRCMSFDIDTGMHTYMCIYVYMYAVCVTNIHAYIYIYYQLYIHIHTCICKKAFQQHELRIFASEASSRKPTGPKLQASGLEDPTATRRRKSSKAASHQKTH